MTKPLSKMDSILIIGGGTFGTSTAYHLATRGYTNVTVVDRFECPSTISAGNDLNKVVRSDYAEPLYADLAQESTQAWTDPEGIFDGLYHQSGWILAAPDNDKSLEFIEGARETARSRGYEEAQQISADEVKRRWPTYSGEMKDWKMYFARSAAWVEARTALSRMASAAQAKGVRYISGEAGHVQRLMFDAAGTCTGALVATGEIQSADHVILAAGAAAGSLLDMGGQLVAKGHVVGHIQLTPQEATEYKDNPIVDHFEGGMMFPPQEDNIIKVAACQWVTNYDGKADGVGVSLPRYRCDNHGDGVPRPVEEQMRNWIRQLAPELADRMWSEKYICWDADTSDFNFIISAHPTHQNLKLAVGGSAHGFKFLPVIGKYIVDLMEGALDADIARKWRWRPGVSSALNAHPLPTIDLSSILGWGKLEARL